MEAFVVVEAPEPDRIARYPDIAGSQVDITAAHETDKFDAVPDVSIRDEDYDRIGCYNNRRRSNDDGRRRRLWSDHHRRRRYGDDRRPDINPAWFNHTP